MTHPTSEQLSAWIDQPEHGALAPEELHAIEAHLADCEACLAIVLGVMTALEEIARWPESEVRR